VNITEWAKNKATQFISPLGNRWLHVQEVVRNAYQIGVIFNEADHAFLIAAAYLHDIGYAPSLQKTGFHPIDGANYLRQHNQERLASLVAYHSGAQFEAHLRGFTPELLTFPREYSMVDNALTYCDMHAGPTGQHISFQQRIDDIFQRYPEEHIVNKAIHQALPSLREAVERTENMLQTIK
jgi:hypothetical protein